MLQVTGKKRLIRDWLKDNHNKAFLVIIVLGIILRLYYFSLTYNQPLWWDEADYLAYAKNIAGLNSDWIVTQQHNSIFPYLVSVFFMLNLSEAIAKFALEIIPSILLIYLAYAIASKMYSDKRIALISSFLMSVFWVMLFNSMRFHLETPGMLLGMLAIYVFWQGYERNEKIFGKINPKWAIPLTIFLVVLTYSIRRGFFIFGVFFLVYMLATRKLGDLIKDKHNWIGLGVFAVLFFIAEKFVFVSQIADVAPTYIHLDAPINLLPFKVFKSFFSLTGTFLDIFFYLFWFGAILAIVRTAMHAGHIKSSKDAYLKGDIFALIAIAFTLAYFIFIMRTPHSFGEERWYLPLAFGAFVCIARGTIFIADYLGRYKRHLGTLVIIFLIVFGGFYQVKSADYLVKSKANSFEGIRQAGIFISQVSEDNDLIISQPVPQTIYYSERKVLQPENIAGIQGSQYSPEEFLEGLKNYPEAKYLLVSFSEPGHPDWMARTYTSNGALAGWEIGFMDTRIDFVNKQQQISPSKTFENGITLELLEIKQDVFIYKIKKSLSFTPH